MGEKLRMRLSNSHLSRLTALGAKFDDWPGYKSARSIMSSIYNPPRLYIKTPSITSTSGLFLQSQGFAFAL